MRRVLFVGCGITNALSSSILQNICKGLTLVCWEKTQYFGGRMRTWVASSNERSTVAVDLGAQYISLTSSYANDHKKFYEELEANEILVPLSCKIGGLKEGTQGMKHYILPRGSDSLVQHYFQKGNVYVKLGYPVTEINAVKNCWEVSIADGYKELFDIVVLSMPIPEILEIKGSIKKLIENDNSLNRNLKSVKYSSRYALGLCFPSRSFVTLPDGNDAIYISSDPVFRFISLDGRKKGLDNDAATVLAHTSISFGEENSNMTMQEVETYLLKQLKLLYPHWPDPFLIRCHKWIYSQVLSAYPGLPGAVSIGDGLIVGGDGFSHSSFDGCIDSAEAVVREILHYLKKLGVW